jgi:hypothetical protein
LEESPDTNNEANVAVPEPEMVGLVIVGEVNVLFVNVSVPLSVERVPLVGSVTFVGPLDVIVAVYAPKVAKVLPGANDKAAFDPAGVTIETLFIVLTTCKLPFNDASFATYKCPFNDESPVINKRELPTTSPVKLEVLFNPLIADVGIDPAG